jgi:hypothetical protein
LNPRPPEPHSGALPDCATSRPPLDLLKPDRRRSVVDSRASHNWRDDNGLVSWGIRHSSAQAARFLPLPTLRIGASGLGRDQSPDQHICSRLIPAAPSSRIRSHAVHWLLGRPTEDAPFVNAATIGEATQPAQRILGSAGRCAWLRFPLADSRQNQRRHLPRGPATKYRLDTPPIPRPRSNPIA